MPTTTPTITPTISRPTNQSGSAGDQLVALGWEINANQYQAVHLAARYETQLEWLGDGHKNAATGIAQRLQIHASTAREWIRVGHALPYLPLIDAAFSANDISYAKAQILTRWADQDNEDELLTLAYDRTAHRLSAAIAKALDGEDPDDDARDQRHHDARSLTSYTQGDGMVVIRLVLPPAIAKMILAILETLMRRIAQTPLAAPVDAATETDADPFANGSPTPTVVEQPDPVTQSGQHPFANGSPTPNAVEPTSPVTKRGLPATLEQLRRRWQPAGDDDPYIPTFAQQRADAFAAFFLGLDIDLTTEIVIHIRGDGNTFDDGTPITTNAITQHLDDAFIRLLIHDAEQRPVNASSRRRHPTTQQKRVVLETHNHECVDCQSTDLLEFDHNPPYAETRHTITDELEPRCPPCHRAHHRNTQNTAA